MGVKLDLPNFKPKGGSKEGKNSRPCYHAINEGWTRKVFISLSFGFN